MGKTWVSPINLTGIFVEPKVFWRENIHGGWATILVLIFILIWHLTRAFTKRQRSVVAQRSVVTKATQTVSHNGSSRFKIDEIIPDVELRNLINALDGKPDEKEKWDNVIDRKNNLLYYNAKCCKPKDEALKYRSVAIFENCSTEFLRDFYMNNDYRKQWDKMLVEHEQLEIDETNGAEIGRMIKKFPLLTPREYVLAWRLWEGREKTYYCFIKECEHALAPKQKKYVRVGIFRSGWRISKVPGRNACEIKMVHQEDAGLNVEFAKLAFARGIWSYMCKMDGALRKYSSISLPLPNSAMTAFSIIQKVPPELDAISEITPPALPSKSAEQVIGETNQRKFSRRPSKKLIANGLLLLGGIIFLSRGHSMIGPNLALPCILKKLTKRGASSSQTIQNRVTHQ